MRWLCELNKDLMLKKSPINRHLNLLF
uniref:Uncharacterized protein n=1 Tax=Anguilla anguilla TaxID=7936 RepID=A0A0E9U1V2_ANGAN